MLCSPPRFFACVTLMAQYDGMQLHWRAQCACVWLPHS
jgi:hypothetical protein